MKKGSKKPRIVDPNILAKLRKEEVNNLCDGFFERLVEKIAHMIAEKHMDVIEAKLNERVARNRGLAKVLRRI